VNHGVGGRSGLGDGPVGFGLGELDGDERDILGELEGADALLRIIAHHDELIGGGMGTGLRNFVVRFTDNYPLF